MLLDQAFRLSSILLAAAGFRQPDARHNPPPWLLVLAVPRLRWLCCGSAPRRDVRHHAPLPALRPHLEYFSPARLRRILDRPVADFSGSPASRIHFLVLLLVNKLSNLDLRRDFCISMPSASLRSWHPPR